VEQSHKHGPVRDEFLAHETRGLVQGDKRSHAEEWRESEYPGEDQPSGDQGILPRDLRSAPPGMTPEDVDERAELGRFLGRGAFPGDRDRLLVVAMEHEATDAVIRRLRSLPPGETFRNLQEVAQTLGLGVESRRT